MQTLAILGAGDHGKVVADCAESAGWDEVHFYDDAWPRHRRVEHWPIRGMGSDLLDGACDYDGIIVAIGDPRIRIRRLEALQKQGGYLISRTYRLPWSAGTFGWGRVPWSWPAPSSTPLPRSGLA